MMTKRNDSMANAAKFSTLSKVLLFFFGLVLFQFVACDSEKKNQTEKAETLSTPTDPLNKPKLARITVKKPCDECQTNQYNVDLEFTTIPDGFTFDNITIALTPIDNNPNLSSPNFEYLNREGTTVNGRLTFSGQLPCATGKNLHNVTSIKRNGTDWDLEPNTKSSFPTCPLH